MIGKSLLPLLLLAACSSALAQEGKISRQKVAAVGAQPLKQSELQYNVARVERSLRRVLKLKAAPTAPAAPDAGKLATRLEIVAQFDRLFELARPKFRFTPRKVTFDALLLTISDKNINRAKLEKLISWGAVGRVSPLATSKDPGLSLEDFGVALGLLTARLADLTHTPSSQWSPYLGG